MLFEQIRLNRRRTVWLVAVFILLLAAVGWAVGELVRADGRSGLIVALILSAVYVPFVFLTANRQILAMSGAREVTEGEYPELVHIVEALSMAARIPMPKVYVIDDPSPNAFATGLTPRRSAVAFTTGLLERLNRAELEGVAAHEISHIRNYDIRLKTVAIALVGVIAVLADFGTRLLYWGGIAGGGRARRRNDRNQGLFLLIALVLVILAPIAAQFVRFAVSRNREFLADASAVDLTRNPRGLIEALRKIGEDPHDVRRANDATASLYFAPPKAAFRRLDVSRWFATHPPIRERIRRLEMM